MKFKAKPVVKEAMQLTIENLLEVARFVGKSWEFTKATDGKGLCFVIKTLEGDFNVEVGDWIIKGLRGEFYPCKPDIFEATYEPVSATEGVTE